jgi:ribose transport system permease protein
MLALVLGGMSIFGGSRSQAYAGIVGAITVCVLNQGMLMINVDSTVIQGVRGVIFLILVYTSQKRPQGLPAPEG